MRCHRQFDSYAVWMHLTAEAWTPFSKALKCAPGSRSVQTHQVPHPVLDAAGVAAMLSPCRRSATYSGFHRRHMSM